MWHKLSWLTHKQLEMHVCIFSPVATDALVLKHQAISTQGLSKYPLYWTNIMLHVVLHLLWTSEKIITIWKDMTQLFED